MSAERCHEYNTTFTIAVSLPFCDRTPQRLAAAIVAVGGDFDTVSTVSRGDGAVIREYCIAARSPAHRDEIVKAVKTVPRIAIVAYRDNLPEDGAFEVLAQSSTRQFY